MVENLTWGSIADTEPEKIPDIYPCGQNPDLQVQFIKDCKA